MIMAQEQAILKGRQQFQELVAMVCGSSQQGRAIHEVEKDLWQGLLALGRSLLDGFVKGQGDGNLGATLEHEERVLRRLERTHARRYVSVFGELSIVRHVYGTRPTQKHEVVPLDARLNLPESDFSYLLQEWDQAFCVQGSYAESAASVQRVLGLGQSVRSLEQMSVAMAESVEAFRAAQAPPPAEEQGAIVVMTADCKGVPMRREAADPPAGGGRLSKGQKANKKRMAAVGGVYTVDPFVRSADDVVDEILRKEARQDRPKPQGKQLRAELTRQIDGVEVNGKDRLFAWFHSEVTARNPDGAKPVVCVMDGERALWKRLSAVFGAIVCILDIFHVLERLWQAAHCFHPEGSDQAKVFVQERLRRLLQGQVGRVIGGLRQMATKQGLGGSKLRQLQAAIKYLENNRRFMGYDQYLAAGYPIGSGVAEGACRHLVKDRMEQTGMRWRVTGAQAILDLRAVHVNEQWPQFNADRIDRACRKLYPHREMIQSIWPAAA
jgi:hypothetical protein